MQNSKIPAGTEAEQSTEAEAQVTSSPNNGNTFVSRSLIRPILFSGEMVRAIIDGRKTQTRRIIKSRHESGLFQICRRVTDGQIMNIESLDFDERNAEKDISCPYGNVGDVLWVRETFAIKGQRVFYKADNNDLENAGLKGLYDFVWKPSLFMPKDACRLFLKVTDISVERLHDISHEDAKAEGIEYMDIEEPFTMGYKLYGKHRIPDLLGRKAVTGTPIESYQTLWESINGQKSFDENPWVWVITFERAECPQGLVTTSSRNDGNTVLPAVFNHATDDSGRYLCNAENPMPKQRPDKSRWSHPDSNEVAEDYGKGGGVADGDYVKYACPHCLHKWWVELPN